MSIAAAPPKLIPIAELRKELVRAPDDDNVLVNAQTACIELIESAIGRLFAFRQDYVWDYRIRQTRRNLYIGIIPLTTVKEFLYIPDGVAKANAITYVEGENFDIMDDARGQVTALNPPDGSTGNYSFTRTNRFERGYYKVTVDGGYTEQTLPQELRDALCYQIQFYMMRNERAGDNLLTSTKALPEGASQTMFNPKNLHPQVHALVSRYRQFWR